MQKLQPFIDSLQGFAQKQLNFDRPPKLLLKQDEENSKDVFGQTAFYDPAEESITIFIASRHPKDILRSLAHELVHHTQNLRGDLSPEKCGNMDPGYAQDNDHMRNMEREAYELGNLCFRDWEDGCKKQMQENKNLKENKKMTVKISRKDLKGIITKLLSEKKGWPNFTSGPFLAARKKERQQASQAQADYEAQLRALDAGEAKIDAQSAQAEAEELSTAAEAAQYDKTAAQQADREAQQAVQRALADEIDAQDELASTITIAQEDKDFAVKAAKEQVKWLHLLHPGAKKSNEAMASAIKKLQAKVKAPTTGKLGPETSTKVREFQIALGIPDDGSNRGADGVYGPHTRKMEMRARRPKKKEVKWTAPGQTPDQELVSARTTVGPNQNLADAPLRRRQPAATSMKESSFQTPESEKALNESIFGKKNNEIFNRLKELWTK